MHTLWRPLPFLVYKSSWKFAGGQHLILPKSFRGGSRHFQEGERTTVYMFFHALCTCVNFIVNTFNFADFRFLYENENEIQISIY